MQSIPLMMFHAELDALRQGLHEAVVKERPYNISVADADNLAQQANSQLYGLLYQFSQFDRRFWDRISEFKWVVAENDTYISITGTAMLSKLYSILGTHPMYFVFKKQ